MHMVADSHQWVRPGSTRSIVTRLTTHEPGQNRGTTRASIRGARVGQHCGSTCGRYVAFAVYGDRIEGIPASCTQPEKSVVAELANGRSHQCQVHWGCVGESSTGKLVTIASFCCGVEAKVSMAIPMRAMPNPMSCGRADTSSKNATPQTNPRIGRSSRMALLVTEAIWSIDDPISHVATTVVPTARISSQAFDSRDVGGAA